MFLNRSTYVVLSFGLAFFIFGIKELVGFPIKDSYMLVLSIWSFIATVVQMMETIMSFFPKCREKMFEELRSNGYGDEKTLKKAGLWYYKRINKYESIINIMMFIVLLGGICWFIGGGDYTNNALANGLTLLSISFVFLNMVIKDYALVRIDSFRLKK